MVNIEPAQATVAVPKFTTPDTRTFSPVRPSPAPAELTLLKACGGGAIGRVGPRTFLECVVVVIRYQQDDSNPSFHKALWTKIVVALLSIYENRKSSTVRPDPWD
jgi:hypothetical protein